MDVRQLEALIAIDEHGSFSRAADALGTVQSNISSRIARLETELGTELVDRSSGVLSESGAVVVQRARRVLGEMSGIVADVAELTADVRGPVSLGVIGTAGRWIVPLLLEAQRATYPHIGLRIIEGSNSTLEPQVVNGQLDLGILAWPVEAPELAKADLFSEDLVLIVARDHPLAALGPTITFAELASYELLLPLQGTALRHELEVASRLQGVQLRPLIELDGLRTIASLTFDGHGPSILPATALSMHLADKFVAVHIEGLAKRRVSLVSRRFGFPAAPVRAITALLRETIAHAHVVPDGIYVPTRSSPL
jgi:DNA-binding transcriptional LysR family regulator